MGLERKNGNLFPLYTSKVAALTGLLKLIRCSCKDDCSKRTCTCRRFNLKLSNICGECIDVSSFKLSWNERKWKQMTTITWELLRDNIPFRNKSIYWLRIKRVSFKTIFNFRGKTLISKICFHLGIKAFWRLPVHCKAAKTFVIKWWCQHKIMTSHSFMTCPKYFLHDELYDCQVLYQ